MKYVIEINVDGAAFDENPGYEINRILSFVQMRVSDLSGQIPHEPKLKDSNGNTVGRAVLMDEVRDVFVLENSGGTFISDSPGRGYRPALLVLPEGR